MSSTETPLDRVAAPKRPSLASSPFADDRLFWPFFAVVAGGIAFLKGLRFPVIWAASQAQADYREGFLKRGLFGELCHLLHLNIADYRTFTILSLAILAAFLLLFVHFARRSALTSVPDGPLFTLIAASYCLSYLVSMVGYLDIPLAILALAVLSIRRPAAQLAGVALIGCLAVLFHEMYAVVFLPVTLLPWLLRAETAVRPHTGADRLRSVASAMLAFALPWLAVVALTAHRALTPEQIARLQQAMMAKVNFPAEPRVFEIYSMSAVANIRMMGQYLRGGSWFALQVLNMLAFLPTTLFFLALSLRALPGSARRTLLPRLWIGLAVFAPLAMNLIAYDIYRWAALMCFNSILVLLTVLGARLRSSDTRTIVTPAFQRAALLLIAVNLATNLGMFAHEGKDFPFYQYWSGFIDARHSRGPWIHP